MSRKYTVSEKVVAANRRNLAKAMAVPASIRLRVTERRQAAARANLERAQAARCGRGVSCVGAASIERSLTWAGEDPAEWARHQEQFQQFVSALSGGDPSEPSVVRRPSSLAHGQEPETKDPCNLDREVARGLAELTWRRQRAWRGAAQSQTRRFYALLEQAARAPGPWGAEQALEFAQGLMVRFYDIAAISKELERLEGRMGSVLQAYLYDRYQGDPEYDSGSKPGPRALARLQQIGPVMGNTRLSSGQVREALGYESSGGPPSLERLKANCDRLREESQFLAEMYPEQAAELDAALAEKLGTTDSGSKDVGLSVVAGRLRLARDDGFRTTEEVTVPEDYEDHGARVRAAFHGGEEAEMRELVEEIARVSWEWLQRLKKEREAERQRVARAVEVAPAFRPAGAGLKPDATPASGKKGATQPSAYRRARKAAAELLMAVRTVNGPWQELFERLKKLREGLTAWLAAAYGNEAALSFAG